MKALEIKLLQKPRELLINYDNGVQQRFDCEYLYRKLINANVPSEINVISINMVNDIEFIFNDGSKVHTTWEVLSNLGNNHDT